ASRGAGRRQLPLAERLHGARRPRRRSTGRSCGGPLAKWPRGALGKRQGRPTADADRRTRRPTMIATLLLVTSVLQAPPGNHADLQQSLTDIDALISSGHASQALEKLQSLPQDDARVKYLKGVAFY